MAGDRLGCGTHTAFITGKGGYPRMCTLTNPIEVRWCRELDDTGDAFVKVQLGGGASEACCKCIGELHPWCHELHLQRDGEEVWAGVIWKTEESYDEVDIYAKDFSYWLDRRSFGPLNFVATDLASIAQQIVTAALLPDDPNLLPSLQVSFAGQLGDRTYAECTNAGEALRELARNGVDFTVLGRRIVIAGDEIPLSPIGTIQDMHLLNEGVKIILDGSLSATSWCVKGNGVFGHCAAPPAEEFCYGLVEQQVEESDIADQASADAAACSRLEGSNPVPLFIDFGGASTLAPETPFTIDQLVPGVLIQVALASFCRPVSQRLRLQSLCVVETPEVGELVQATLGPVGLVGQNVGAP